MDSGTGLGWGSGHSHAPLLTVWGKGGKDTILEVAKEILIAFITLAIAQLVSQRTTMKLTPIELRVWCFQQIKHHLCFRFQLFNWLYTNYDFLRRYTRCITVKSLYGLLTCNLLQGEATDMILINLWPGKLSALHQTS